MTALVAVIHALRIASARTVFVDPRERGGRNAAASPRPSSPHVLRQSTPCRMVLDGFSWILATSARLSGSVFVDRLHGVDSTRFGTLANDPGHEEGSTP
ncbi:MAG: hypothetical protein U0S49_13730, partial [Rhodospirillales bacterium]|nr:hypothetical protein [Rhodospirillales bacterium]